MEFGLIEEATKPGSKTRYYKRLESDLTKRIQETFNLKRFNEQSVEEKEELCNLYADLNKTSHIMMLNALKYLIKNYYEGLSDYSVDERYEILGELTMATFHLSEESFKAFKKEQRDLAQKYLAIDRENPDRKKPYAYYYAGYNVEKTLERMQKKKKKR